MTKFSVYFRNVLLPYNINIISVPHKHWPALECLFYMEPKTATRGENHWL